MATATQMTLSPKLDEILYPESDGKPMAENTLQFQWIVMLKENIETLFADRPDVFVAGDLLWYPVEGQRLATAPDTMVVFGRPKGYRGSYKQWEEADIAPQVVFEVISPGNKPMRLNSPDDEMGNKLRFYEQHGVRECYYYDPETNGFRAWVRSSGTRPLEEVDVLEEWVSPLLGVRFATGENPMEIYYPDGGRFQTHQELFAERNNAIRMADREYARAQEEYNRAQQERNRAQQEYERAERLAARLRELGIAE